MRLETKRLRLRLRRHVLGDAAEIFEMYARDPEVARYVTWRPHARVRTVREVLRGRAAAWRVGTAFSWAVTLREGGNVVGNVEARPAGHRVELGYVLARACWGRGLMTEAAGAVAEWALAQPGVWRLWAVCDVDNAPSARVLEKIGMTREGRLRAWTVHPNVSAAPRDCWCSARVREAG
jgi:ribosomal-protein-alanine N-acetyltransferase